MLRRRRIFPVQKRTHAELRWRQMRLEAQIAKQMEAYEKRPKRRFLGARAEEYRFARYVEDWRLKVERIGNLNYPAAARSKKLYGSLLLTGGHPSRREPGQHRARPLVRPEDPRSRRAEDRRNGRPLLPVPARHQARHRHHLHHADLDALAPGDSLTSQ